MMAKDSNVDEDKIERDRLEWIKTFNELQDYEKNRGSLREKMKSKIKENPFVPIGLIATTIALSAGLYAMKTGNKRRSQLMMRARVGAQGFTVAALLLGIVVASQTKPTKP